MLFLGERMSAERAHTVGMVNRVVPAARLRQETLAIAAGIAKMPRLALALTKKAINQAEDRMGLRDSMDASFALHHLAHAHNSLTTPDHLAGEDVSHMSETELAEVRNRRIGFVFQQFNLLSSMSAWQNVELPLVYAGVPRTERKERAMDALAKVGLSSRVLHRPGELSGGQQQRVAVARALVTEPDLILADEPTGNLDSKSAADVLRLMAELHDSGRTLVLITHDSDVASAAGRVVGIRDGLLTENDRRYLESVR